MRTLARVGTEFVILVTGDGDPNDYFDLVDASLDGPFEWEATTP